MFNSIRKISRRTGDVLAQNLPTAAYLVVAVGVATRWYGRARLVWGDDAAFPFTPARVVDYLHFLDRGLGAPDGRKFPFLLPFGGLLWAWRALSLPYDVTAVQPLVVVVLLAATGITSYALIRYLLPSLPRWAAFGGGLGYAFNFYAMTTVWAAMSFLVVEYALLPLVVVGWVAALRRASLTASIGAALLWLVALTPVYITTPVATTDTALFVAVAAAIAVTASRRRLATVFCAVALYGTWLAGSLFWILPVNAAVASVRAQGLSGGDPARLFALNSARFGDAIRLGGYWGITADFAGYPYFAWKQYYETVGLPFAASLPILATLGVVTLFVHGRQRSRVLTDAERRIGWFALGVVVVTLFLITGTHSPLGGAKRHVVDQLQLEGPFRSVYQRFGGYLALAYAPLVALGVATLGRLAARVPPRRIVRVVAVGAAVICVAVVPAWPMWDGTLLDASGPIPARRIEVPTDYHRVADLINATPGDFDVLVLPFGGAGVTATAWDGLNEGYLPREPILGYHGIEPLVLMLDKGVVTGDGTARYLYRWAAAVARGTKQARAALRLLNAGYIVLHLDENLPLLEGSGRWTGLAIRQVAGRLDRMPGVKAVYTSYTLRVYRVMSWRRFRVFGVRRGNHRSLDAQRLLSLPYTSHGLGHFVVDTSRLRRGDLLVVDRPYDGRWAADGARVRRIAPGLPAFAVRGATTSVVFPPERRVRRALLLLPGSLALTVVALAVGMWRRRRRGDA
jgi:hypothetical protein